MKHAGSNRQPWWQTVLALGMAWAGIVSVSAQPPPAVLIEDVTLIDGTGGPPVPHVWVLVEEGRIRSVARGPSSLPEAVRRIDGRGKYLIPGLVDMHVHLRGGRGPEGPDESQGIRALHGYLYSGVTSIYDAGNNPDFIFSLREKQRSGQIVSPRIFATGGIVTYPGSHGSGPGATLVDSWPEAIPKLDAHIARQPDLLKLTFEERGWGTRPMIPLLPPDLMEKIIQYYNDHGIRTTVHTSSEFRARQAIFAGVDTLAHPVIQGPITDQFARLMGAKKIPMVSTLTIGEGYSRLVEHPEYLDQPLYRAVLEPEEITRLKTEVRRQFEERPWTWWMKIMTPVAQENLRKIHEAGGVIVVGTDQSLGPAVHREMELLAAAGIAPLEVIRMATLHGAVFLGRERELGTIEEGKLADLVLLGANPAENIENARQVEMVMVGGRIIDLKSLHLPVNRK